MVRNMAVYRAYKRRGHTLDLRAVSYSDQLIKPVPTAVPGRVRAGYRYVPEAASYQYSCVRAYIDAVLL